MRNFIFFLAFTIGGLGAGLLAGSQFRGSETPCFGLGTCDLLTKSEYGVLGGVPLSYIAVAYYLSLIFALLLKTSKSSKIRSYASVWVSVSLPLASIAGVSLSIWAVLILKGFCVWCYAIAVSMASMLISDSSGTQRVRRLLICFPAASIIVGIIVSGLSAQALPGINSEVLSKLTREDLDPAGAYYLGNPRGRNLIIVFSDLQCPACGSAHAKIRPQLRVQSDWKLVFRHKPLKSHSQSQVAALTAEIAGSLGAFWDFVEACYTESPTSREQFDALGKRFGVTEDIIPKHLQIATRNVARDIRLADRLNLSGTPTYIIKANNGSARRSSPSEVMRLLLQTTN